MDEFLPLPPLIPPIASAAGRLRGVTAGVATAIAKRKKTLNK